MLVRIALFIVIVALAPLGVAADEFDGTSTNAIGWVGAGALVVNSGVAMANGFSLTAGTSNRTNGIYSMILGSTTMAISAVGLATAEDKQSQDFSLLLGAAGVASTVTGALSVKFSGPHGEHVSLSPLVNPFGSEDKAKAGMQMRIRF